MNERINELMEQAGLYNFVIESMGIDEEMKKFAELIVGECIHQCKKDMVPDEDVVEGYDEDWNMALKHSVEQIKQHFGVEEKTVCHHDWYSAKNPVVLNGSVCVICGAIDPREPEELKNE